MAQRLVGVRKRRRQRQLRPRKGRTFGGRRDFRGIVQVTSSPHLEAGQLTTHCTQLGTGRRHLAT